MLEDTDGNKIEFVLNTNTGNGAREKTAILIAADLKKLGLNVVFQPIEFNTLIARIDDTTTMIVSSWGSLPVPAPIRPTA